MALLRGFLIPAIQEMDPSVEWLRISYLRTTVPAKGVPWKQHRRQMRTMTELLEQARELRDEHGDDWDVVLAVLREAGVSIVESAIVTSRTLGVDLGVAKRIVHYSPVWADRSDSAEQIHEVFSSTFEDLAS